MYGNLNNARLCKGMESVDHTIDQINWPVPDCFDKADLNVGGRRFDPGRERPVFTSNTCYRFSGCLSGAFSWLCDFSPPSSPLPYHHLVKVIHLYFQTLQKSHRNVNRKITVQLSVTRK